MSSEIPECPNCKKPLDAVRVWGVVYAHVFEWADGKYEVTRLEDYEDTYKCAKCGHRLGGELREFFLRHQARRGGIMHPKEGKKSGEDPRRRDSSIHFIMPVFGFSIRELLSTSGIE